MMENKIRFNQNNEDFKVTILTTGGTIEKTYDEIEGLLENKKSIFQQKILSKLRLPNTEIKVRPILSKDSLYMDDKDREIIYQAILAELKNPQPILILHGTDTMALTAEYCYNKFLENNLLNVALVFTGAMIPLGFDDSDSTQNVVEALLCSKYLSPGIYVSFHNQIFKVPNVQKNKLKRTFEKKYEDN